jgi:hypothetical protein
VNVRQRGNSTLELSMSDPAYVTCVRRTTENCENFGFTVRTRSSPRAFGRSFGASVPMGCRQLVLG